MPIRKFGWNKESLLGFAWHQGIGAVCFFFDLAVIYLAIHAMHLHYPAAVAIGFILATLLNYVLARSTIYANSERSHDTAMLYFFAIASVMLLFTVGGTVYLHEALKLHIYVARVLIGIVVSIVGYLCDCLITFRLK